MGGVLTDGDGKDVCWRKACLMEEAVWTNAWRQKSTGLV